MSGVSEKRGVAIQFGPDITKSFLERNGLEVVIRSHEVKDEGYSIEQEGNVSTLTMRGYDTPAVVAPCTAMDGGWRALTGSERRVAWGLPQ